MCGIVARCRSGTEVATLGYCPSVEDGVVKELGGGEPTRARRAGIKCPTIAKPLALIFGRSCRLLAAFGVTQYISVLKRIAARAIFPHRPIRVDPYIQWWEVSSLLTQQQDTRCASFVFGAILAEDHSCTRCVSRTNWTWTLIGRCNGQLQGRALEIRGD